MDQEVIKFEQRGPVGWVTLNRPEAMNSLTPQLGKELGRALTQAEADASVRALVITGAEPAFCAGADLKFIGGESESTFSDALACFLDELSDVFNRIEASPLPTIAAVNGLALDIRRHMNHEPVWAGSPSVFYRLRKFIRRHRLGVTAGAAVATGRC